MAEEGPAAPRGPSRDEVYARFVPDIPDPGGLEDHPQVTSMI